MKILILGATGFIGNAIFHTLVQEHSIYIASRNPVDGYQNWKQVDFTKENNWASLIKDIDLVINCIGIIEGDFAKIQVDSPISLYKECIKQEIKIIHISAIGAHIEQPVSEFLKSKKQTDDYLLQYNKAKVIYPAVVIGKQGKSAQFFAELTSFPILPMIRMNDLPFIHINQLCKLVQQITKDFDTIPQQIIAFAKPEPLLPVLQAIKGKKISAFYLPKSIFKLIFKLFPNFSVGIFNKTTFDLSEIDLTAHYKPMFKKVSTIIEANSIQKSNIFLHLIALFTLSFVWIWSGVSSLISWNISMDLMKDITKDNQHSALAIYLGSFVDIVLGISILFKKVRQKTILLQLIIIIAYTVLLSVYSPSFWVHPFGILSKNIPLIVLSWYLYNVKD